MLSIETAIAPRTSAPEPVVLARRAGADPDQPPLDPVGRRRSGEGVDLAGDRRTPVAWLHPRRPEPLGDPRVEDPPVEPLEAAVDPVVDEPVADVARAGPLGRRAGKPQTAGREPLEVAGDLRGRDRGDELGLDRQQAGGVDEAHAAGFNEARSTIQG